MNPIKVVHIHEVEKEAFYFSNLVDFVDPNDVDFSFVTFAPEGDFTESMRKRNIRVFSLNALGKKNLVQAAYQTRKILNDLEPDIVHTHLFNPTLVGQNLGKAQGRKTLITRHHSDALHEIYSTLKRKIYLGLEDRNNRLADHIIAPSRMVYECVVDWEGVAPEKVSIIPYGQKSERFDEITPAALETKRSELGFDNQLSLVCVSRLFNRKGHEYLFEAFGEILKEGVDAKLFLVGTGDYRPKLEKKLRDLQIEDNVEFLGWRSDALEIIGAADIIVHPSLEDALSQSLIESLMMERPIVATDISGAADTLDGGKYGYLVEPANSQALKNALLELIKNLDKAKANAVLGKKYILDYMDASRTSAEYLKLYKSVLTK